MNGSAPNESSTGFQSLPLRNCRKPSLWNAGHASWEHKSVITPRTTSTTPPNAVRLAENARSPVLRMLARCQRRLALDHDRLERLFLPGHHRRRQRRVVERRRRLLAVVDRPPQEV